MPIFTDRCTENANFATILIQKTERKCGRKRREVRDLRRQRGDRRRLRRRSYFRKVS